MGDGPVELWKIKWWAGGSGESIGSYHDELIEGDEEAHTRLMELALDQLLSSRMARQHEPTHQRKRRIAIWKRHQEPVDIGISNDDGWKHVDRLEAVRHVDGAWVPVTWTLTEPGIEVTVETEAADV